jgi:hypothetical protein
MNCTQNVKYADLDGNGSQEAYLYAECGEVGQPGPACNAPGASCIAQCANATFYVFEMSPQCSARLLGQLDGGPKAKGTVVGQSFVVELPASWATDPPCGSSGLRQTTYRLSNGKFTSTTKKIK